MINSSPLPRQNDRQFANDILHVFHLLKKVWILITISQRFVPKGWINNKRALVQITAWHPIGDKPLPEPMMA